MEFSYTNQYASHEPINANQLDFEPFRAQQYCIGLLQTESSESSCVWTEDGRILTALHCIFDIERYVEDGIQNPQVDPQEYYAKQIRLVFLKDSKIHIYEAQVDQDSLVKFQNNARYNCQIKGWDYAWLKVADQKQIEEDLGEGLSLDKIDYTYGKPLLIDIPSEFLYMACPEFDFQQRQTFVRKEPIICFNPQSTENNWMDLDYFENEINEPGSCGGGIISERGLFAMKHVGGSCTYLQEICSNEDYQRFELTKGDFLLLKALLNLDQRLNKKKTERKKKKEKMEEMSEKLVEKGEGWLGTLSQKEYIFDVELKGKKSRFIIDNGQNKHFWGWPIPCKGGRTSYFPEETTIEQLVKIVKLFYQSHKIFLEDPANYREDKTLKLYLSKEELGIKDITLTKLLKDINFIHFEAGVPETLKENIWCGHFFVTENLYKNKK